MILAAGLGTRMRPLTEKTPKPLISVAGRPLIEYAFDTLKEAEIGGAVVNAWYLAEQVEDYAARQRDDISVEVIRESERLETGGGIANALPTFAHQPFFSLNSDTICISQHQPALQRMANAWNEDEMDVLMLLHPTKRALGYQGQGDFVLNADNSLFRRRKNNEVGDVVFTGVQLLHPRLFTECPQGAFSMNLLYDRCCDDAGWFSRIGFVIHDGDWLHVGDMDGLKQAEAYFAEAKTPSFA